jgi:ketosteroid isomerase-like protein
MRAFAVLILAATIAATGPAFAQGQTQSANSALYAWMSAFNGGDRTALAALHEPDAQLSIEGQPSIDGPADIASYWGSLMGTLGPMILLTPTSISEGIDTRLVEGRYQVIERGAGLPLGSGRFVQVWQLAPDGFRWRLDRDFRLALDGAPITLSHLLRRLGNLMPTRLTPDEALALTDAF